MPQACRGDTMRKLPAGSRPSSHPPRVGIVGGFSGGFGGGFGGMRYAHCAGQQRVAAAVQFQQQLSAQAV